MRWFDSCFDGRFNEHYWIQLPSATVPILSLQLFNCLRLSFTLNESNNIMLHQRYLSLFKDTLSKYQFFVLSELMTYYLTNGKISNSIILISTQ